jgi:cytidine deaminase
LSGVPDGVLEAAVAAARAAQQRAYARYSRFKVGAAVVDEQGRLHAGCNVENASYGLTICAERNAIGAAILAGAQRITAVAVVTDGDEPGAPCGACRQVLAQFAGDDVPVVLAGPSGPVQKQHTIGALLPHAFRF